MTKHNFFGFESLNDFLNSLVGYKNACIHIIPAFILTITTFITGYIFDSASTVYTLWFLMLCDWATGIWKSIKAKSFVSYKILRMPIYFLCTTLVLSIGWHMSKSNILFYLLPSILTGGFMSVYFVSIIENLGELEYLPKPIIKVLKERFGLKSVIDSLSKEDSKQKK